LDVGALLYFFDPGTHPAVCDARVWLTGLSIVVILANLLVKATRIKQVFGDMTIKVKRVTNSALLLIVGVMVSVELLLLIGFTAAKLSPAESVTASGTDENNVVVLNQCRTSGASYWAWFIIQLVYIGFFLVWGAYVAFGTKDTPSAFNESTHILGALLELIFLGIVLIPLDFINESSPQALVLLRGLGQSFGCLTLALILFGPKIYYIAVGRGNDRSMVDTASYVISRSGTDVQMTPSKGEPQSYQEQPSIARPPTQLGSMTGGMSSHSQLESEVDPVSTPEKAAVHRVPSFEPNDQTIDNSFDKVL